MYRPDRLPKILSPEEMKAILNTFNTRYRAPQRHRVAFRLMGEAGLRSAEVTGLERDHVTLDEAGGEIRVRSGKYGKDRTLWINPGLRDEIADWLNRGDWEKVPETPYLLPTRTGNRLDTSTLRKALSRAVEKAVESGAEIEEPERISCHTWRHSYGAHLYAKTKDIRLVQENLGHADLSSTMLYTALVNGEREEAGRSFRLVE